MKQPELVNIRQNHNNNAVPPTPTATDKWRPLTKHLRGTTPHLLSLWGALFGFLSFFSMMAFTKSFVAFTWREEGDWVPGIDYKTAISVFQMFSYTISKWVGIKIVPGIARRGPARFYYLLANGAIAFLGLILFGFLPPKFRVIGPVLTG